MIPLLSKIKKMLMKLIISKQKTKERVSSGPKSKKVLRNKSKPLARMKRRSRLRKRQRKWQNRLQMHFLSSKSYLGSSINTVMQLTSSIKMVLVKSITSLEMKTLENASCITSSTFSSLCIYHRLKSYREMKLQLILLTRNLI